MFSSKALNDLGQKHGTDKCSGPNGHDYLRKYEFFLRPLKDADFVFLELGVYKGASLRTWSDYFTKATIHGVDIEEQVRDYDVGRAQLTIGDLSKNAFLENLIDLRPKVVLDDASHWWPDQLRALFTLYPRLQPGALYILEDIHTSFVPLAKHFSAGLDTPPFYLLLKLAEYLTANDRPSPIVKDQNLVPLSRAEKFGDEIRALADMTEAVIFIERACLLAKK
ncbi:MAG: class I SAM-dependent methyltransferase [Deltaproteobacteria bacterium]|jgi:hypothetical protein|nr:class I SAM-dependent methyltransferase [Deltaproteobacteria bacterium]